MQYILYLTGIQRAQDRWHHVTTLIRGTSVEICEDEAWSRDSPALSHRTFEACSCSIIWAITTARNKHKKSQAQNKFVNI